jgi:tRNA G18 (ribose-2'-O)-methylase SpoU
MNMDIIYGIKLINKACENRMYEQLEQRWIIGGYDKEMSFSEFKDKLIIHRSNISKTDEEILLDVKNIINDFNKKN